MAVQLNIGSSHAKGQYKDWINLDIQKFKGVNVVGSGFSLPFRNNTFHTIHAIHVLEHLTRDKFPLMLAELFRVLRPLDGVAYIEVPDFKETIKMLHESYEKEDYQAVHIWRTSVYGKTERKGMAHHFGFDEKTLTQYMTDAGFAFIVRVRDVELMVSSHYKQEPILLVKARKRA